MAVPPPTSANPPPLNDGNPFPASAQWTLALILGLVFLLVAWRGWTDRTGTRPTEVQSHRTDLNNASRSELQQLPGVGPRTADTLLAHRDTVGGFPHVEDIKNVKGIGEKKQTRLRPWINLADEEQSSAEDPQHLTHKPALPAEPAPRNQKPLPDAKVNINEATALDLQRLPSIGPTLSQRIVDERNRKLFEKVDDLRRVSGIGVKTMEKLRPYVMVGEGQ